MNLGTTMSWAASYGCSGKGPLRASSGHSRAAQAHWEHLRTPSPRIYLTPRFSVIRLASMPHSPPSRMPPGAAFRSNSVVQIEAEGRDRCTQEEQVSLPHE